MISAVESHSDMKSNTWLEKILPQAVFPYAQLARWDRPIGIMLTLYPSLWALTLACEGIPSLRLLFLFIVGAIVMRGAGCTYNDLVDFDLDAKVERTKERPLASGRLKKRHALGFLLLQLLVGFIILLQLTPQAIFFGMAGAVLICLYPWMKRFTYWPQAFLGIAFNWGIFIAWVSVKPSLNLAPVLLYGSAFLWTLTYDTIYAHQDKTDDMLIGVKSTALKFGSKTKSILRLFSSVQLGLLIAVGIAQKLHWPYALGLTVVGLHLLWQIVSLDIDNPRDCLIKFKSNQWLGLVLLLGILFGC